MMKTETLKNDYPPTPELDKMLKVKEKSQAIGEFLEWLQQEDFSIAQYDSKSDVLFATPYHTEGLLAKFFGINLKKVEQERSAILDWMRNNKSK